MRDEDQRTAVWGTRAVHPTHPLAAWGQRPQVCFCPLCSAPRTTSMFSVSGVTRPRTLSWGHSTWKTTPGPFRFLSLTAHGGL